MKRTELIGWLLSVGCELRRAGHGHELYVCRSAGKKLIVPLQSDLAPGLAERVRQYLDPAEVHEE
jgi:hypothetical protein